ncbi:long-chain-fatty acid--ACP ligase MbtM [Gordonia paraffinivorans]|uniref:long-chain-fatty acid--ACP ligase MbtM n=1 Tax=Gordonia paraffinivorans TaxID=175628 RepID=UPI0014473BB3|nr:long-chain-fatty acid--ACP ligase MbtM [Gordonia paraffinivorans]
MSQSIVVLKESGSTNTLAATVREAMTAGDTTLSVLDSDSGEWVTLPWRDVHARAEQIAVQLLADSDRHEPLALGLIGDPTVDLIAAIQGAWLAGVPISILPGPIRGADEERWAQNTYNRFISIGVGTVLGSGHQLDLLSKVEGQLTIARVGEYGLGVDTASFTARNCSANTVAVLQGTAGSTGDPKTAVLSASAVYSNAIELVSRLGLHRTRDTGFSWLPLYHDMGLMFLLAGMTTGISTYIVPNTAFAAAPFKWMQWLTETKATVTAAPNFAYDILGRYGKLLRDIDLSHLRVAISGGEPIDADAFDKFLDAVEPFGFWRNAAAPAYGMAESACAVTMPAVGEGAHYDEVTVTPPDGGEPIRRRYAILGKPLGGMQVRIVEPNTDVPRIDGRSVGHVEIRGTSMMRGYLGDADLGEGEWFSTGDLGYLVDDRLVICGRAKEVIIVAGRNLFPIEIERAAAEVAGVRRGGVVAMARGEGSSRPGLVIIAEYKGGDFDKARSEVMSEVASACAIVPAEVIFVAPDSVPRTTSGKIRRLETRKMVEDGRLAPLGQEGEQK